MCLKKHKKILKKIKMTSTLTDCNSSLCEIESNASGDVTMSNQNQRRCLHVRYCGDVVHNFHLLMVRNFLFNFFFTRVTFG